MNLHDTKALYEVCDCNAANEYIKLGWVLVNQYVSDYYGGQFPSIRHETIQYVLAWQGEGEPKKPPSRFDNIQTIVVDGSPKQSARQEGTF